MAWKAIVLGLFLWFPVWALGRTHHVTTFEHSEFNGAKKEYNLDVGECVSSGVSDISSVNTGGHCLVLYKNNDCTGSGSSITYLYPGSKSHNNLRDLSFNDATSSFGLCSLDEEFLCRLCHRGLSDGEPEYEFFKAVFRAISNSLLNSYINAVRRQFRYIWWSFVPGIDSRLSKGQQYQAVLEWVMDGVEDRHEFSSEELQNMRDLAGRVVQARADANSRHPRDGSRSDAVHIAIERIWRSLKDLIEKEIERLDNHDELRRRMFSMFFI